MAKEVSFNFFILMIVDLLEQRLSANTYSVLN